MAIIIKCIVIAILLCFCICLSVCAVQSTKVSLWHHFAYGLLLVYWKGSELSSIIKWGSHFGVELLELSIEAYTKR